MSWMSFGMNPHAQGHVRTQSIFEIQHQILVHLIMHRIGRNVNPDDKLSATKSGPGLVPNGIVGHTD